jgi:nitrite reductase/ring-hydroxylating ferredoxin subunit
MAARTECTQEQQRPRAATAPPASRFPAYPASWYLFGRGDELRRGPVSKDLIGRRLVAYRTAGGRAVVMDARCAHLGADLGRGRVVGDGLQCPFHNWEYGPDGRCTHIPHAADIPPFARLACYPVEERHGFVFFFNGRRPLFPLPFFVGAAPEEFVAGRPFRFVADCSWFMLAANGFDQEHFGAVHDRTLLAPPTVDCPAPFARRMHYTAEVTGDSAFDRLLRCFVGRVVDVTITSWGGPLILVTGDFGRAFSRILIATQPRPDGRTQAEVIVFARRGRSWPARLLRPLTLWLRRVFTQGFMRDDIDRLGGVRYNPHALVEGDRLMIEFFDWAASLPQGAGGADGPDDGRLSERSAP